MTIRQLPSGSYRIEQMYNGKRYSVVLKHKPTKKEAMIIMSEKMQDNDTGKSTSFEKCAKEYILNKNNILSPATAGGYEKVLRQIDDSFKKMNIYDITQLDIQKEVNRYSEGRKPKTVSNFHGFISAVFGLYRPNMNLSTTLPQKVKYEPYTPTTEEIKRILDASKPNTKYHICFQLGVLSLRRSEVCALTIDDVDFENSTITINKALIYDANNKPYLKPLTKTTEGMRTIYIPKSLSDEIKSQGFIIDVLPNNLVKVLHEYQDELGIEQFRFHDLRHFFASYAHSQGMSEADIMATGGWQSDYTMKRVYRHSMEKEKLENQKKIANGLLS